MIFPCSVFRGPPLRVLRGISEYSPSPGQKTKIEYGKKCERSDSKLASLLQDENLAVCDWSR